MANLKNITDLPIAESADGANLIVNDHGVAKQIPSGAVGAQSDWAETDNKSPAFIKNKPSKELIYEWNFSADDEVYEIYEIVNDDLSWLTRYQDGVSFEIIVENYGYDYRYSNDEGEHDHVYYENTFSTVSSTELPCYNRVTNIPSSFGDPAFILKEMLYGYLSGEEISVPLEDTDTGYREFRIQPWNYFSIYNGIHFNDDGMPYVVASGGAMEILADGRSPLKSVKIYKITR